MADDLRLNSLERFSKSSPRLHLEEHGSCEVPAGCGGMVLRWLDPTKGVPILLRGYWPTAPAALFVNDVKPTSMRPLVPPGRVVLALRFGPDAPEPWWSRWWAARPPQDVVFMFAASRPRSGSHSMDAHSEFVARSLPDGSWRYSVTHPPDAWMLPDFDDREWPVLVERTLVPPGKQDYRPFSAHRNLTEVGARPLGLPSRHRGSLWIRTVFSVAPGAPA